MQKYWFNQLQAIAFGVAGPSFGKLFIVMPSADDNYDRMRDTIREVDNEGDVRLFTTLKAAYDACTSNRNDVILLSGNATHTLANGLAWSKSRIHVVGLDMGGNRLVQQGAKVASTDAAADAYVLKVTGTRNSFKNIKFIQIDTNAAALNVLQEGAEGSLYENCTFTFGVVDNLDLTTASEVLCGSDSATFLKCSFGTETLLTSAARTIFKIDQVTASQEFKSNVLKECIFLVSSSSNGAVLVGVVANTDVLFTNLFDKCIFMASLDSAGGIAITNAVQSVAGLTKGTLNFANCVSFNCTNFCITLTAQVQTYGPITSGQAGEGGTPS